DCEIFDMVRQVLAGIVVDDDSLALEVIDAVGPGGTFLTQKHTKKNMRELWLPKYMDRRPYEVWQEQEDGAVDWATAEARRILAEHRPEPLDPALSAELSRIIASVEV
ncbi:MAG: trimethylamine methyltransferase family protein, partial [Chloroflexota bacterium]